MAALGGVVVAVGVAALVIGFARVDVCDEQLTDSGNVVEVCRHLQITDPPIIAAGLVVLAALGTFFTEVGAFGVSLKRDVRDAKAAATDALDAARSAETASRSAADAATAAERTATDSQTVSAKAREVAEHASGAAQSATSAAQIAEQLAQQALAPSQPVPDTKATDLGREIRNLGEEYNTIRRDLPPGSARTARMTSIVGRMIGLFTDRTISDVGLSELLTSGDRGLRLAGYSYLYAHPQPIETTVLADAVLKEDKPFGQYWGLRALRRQVEADPHLLDLNTKPRLAELLSRLKSETDRAHELRAILTAVPDEVD